MANLALAPARPPVLGPDTSTPQQRTGVAMGFVGLTLSVVFMAYLHVVASGQLSPVDTTMSDYVFADVIGWMFGASVLSMAVGAFGAFRGLAAMGLLARPLPRLALSLVMLGAVLVALFPTDQGETLEALSLPAEIHRYAAGVVFFSLPIAALLVSSRLGALPRYRKWLRGTVFVTTVALVVFLTSHFGMMPEAIQDLRGVAQRLLFVLELEVLGQLIYLPMRYAAINR
ncbi:MAG: DUF998 domain-containing protein [Pseudonocardiaceae bacterium]|nr:DUF998 domain-containing protein [Pseudonocardiaceae bacterium]